MSPSRLSNIHHPPPQHPYLDPEGKDSGIPFLTENIQKTDIQPEKDLTLKLYVTRRDMTPSNGITIGYMRGVPVVSFPPTVGKV